MKMRTLSKLFTLVFVGTVLFTSCSKTESARVRLDDTATVIVPDTITASTFEVTTSNIANTLKSQLSDEGFDMDDLKSVKLQAMELQVTSPDDGDFSFCTDVDVYLSVSGQSDTLIASIGSGNMDYLKKNPLFLLKPEINLIDYFNSDDISYRLVFTMRRANYVNYDVLVKPIFFAEAEKE